MAAAENNLCVVADRILELLRSEDVREMVGSLWGTAERDDMLQRLEMAISELAPLLPDAEIQARHNEELELWLKGDVEDTLCIVENWLEEQATEALMKRSSGGVAARKNMYTTISSFFSTTTRPTATSLDFHDIRDCIECIEVTVDVFKSDFNLEKRRDKEIEFPNGMASICSFIVREGGSKHVVQRRSDIIDVDAKEKIIHFLLGHDDDDEQQQQQNVATVVVALNDDEQQQSVATVVLVLEDDDDEQQQQNVATVVPVLGMEQSETRRLAREVFNDERVRNHFHKRIWVCLSSSGTSPINNSTQLLNVLVACLHPNHHPNMEQSDLDMLMNLLVSSLLSSVPFLIVLDDVNPQNFLFLKGILGNFEGNGSKIIITTCNPEVANNIGTIQPYCLASYCPFPSEDQLWRLFRNAVFGVQEHEGIHSRVREIGKMIVERCDGIISDIVTTAIGSMLYFENSEGELIHFYEIVLFEIEKSHEHDSSDYERVLSLLKLCYDHLPSRLKHCFAYCSLFPKDHEFDVQMMIKLWMAQGFIITDHPEKSAEDVGYEYVLNLLRRSFFQEPTIDVMNRVVKFKIHHLMHDLATVVAEGKCLFSSPFDAKVDYPAHVSFEYSAVSIMGDVAEGFSGNRIRSVLLQSQWWRSGERHDNDTLFDRIISKCDHSRALEMRDFGIRIVPSSIEKLKFLKYLDLSENEDILKLPNSITKLVNLQTLRLSSCFKIRQLPRDIQNLISLRHLEIDGCHNLTSLPQGFGHLTNLQTLSHVMLGEVSSAHDAQLIEVKKLISLCGTFQLKNLSHEISEATYLNAVPNRVRSLSLEWNIQEMKRIDQMPPVPPLDNDNFSSHLEELTINGYKGVVLFSPSLVKLGNLVKLSLRSCSFCQSLPSLDDLIHLKVLALDEMVNLQHISTSLFLPSIKELWLTELPKLERWWENNDTTHDLVSSFPCLSKLVIEDCPKLDSMPLFPTLEEGLVLDTTSWIPFKLTMSNQASPSPSPSPSSSSPPLSKLKNMCIGGINELDDNEAGQIKWDTLESLEFLRLDCLPLKTLPSGLRDIITLQELHISRCAIRDINGIEALEFLENLVIRLCPKLESLPEGIHSLKCMKTLEIQRCPSLTRRYQKITSAYWNKIAHIPHVRLDWIPVE
ncbi:putative disease resistance protein RGA3 [Humulus lupulus]|uniref:putative disease resistance protein RGA3 n=1 Tax=Humulus lupulus TaxID=3486 RepID=UPI002B40F214|nr:putative disease resistance protein RGA3 [Humulus lupulus]